MTFTYAGPSGNDPVGAVRFLLGDTDSTEPQLQDEEIQWLYETWGGEKQTPYYIAYRAADAVASKLAREIDISSEGESLALNGLMEKYRSLALSLLEQHKELLGGNATVYVGGVDASEQQDPTVTPPAFGTRMHDNREAGRQDYGNVGDIPDSWWSGQWGEFTP